MATYVITFKKIYQNTWNRELVNGVPKIERKVLGDAKMECNPTGLFLRFRQNELIEKAWEVVRKQHKASGYSQVTIERRHLAGWELEEGVVTMSHA